MQPRRVPYLDRISNGRVKGASSVCSGLVACSHAALRSSSSLKLCTGALGKACPKDVSSSPFAWLYLSVDRSWTWAFPYLGWRDGSEETDVALPLFVQQENKETGSLFRLVLPGYLQIEDGQGDRFDAVGPIWHQDDGARSYDTGIFPLLWWGEEEEESYTRYV